MNFEVLVTVTEIIDIRVMVIKITANPSIRSEYTRESPKKLQGIVQNELLQKVSYPRTAR